jgi:hypothetical protein
MKVMNPSIIQQQGYVWLMQPREGVSPLHLMEKTTEGFFKRLFTKNESAEILNSDVFSMFPKQSKRGNYPEISKPKNVPFFKGYDILDLKSDSNIKSSDEIPLVGKMEASVKLAINSKLLYTFKDITRLHVETEVLLEEHLNLNQPNRKAVGFFEKLQSGNMFVITEILQTTEFSVNEASDFSFNGSISADAIQKYIELKTALEKSNEKNQTISYKNEKPVTIAIKAFKILYNKDKQQYSLSKTSLTTVRGDNSIVGYRLQISGLSLDI